MVNYSVYRAGQFLAQSLPLKDAYRLAVLFSDLHYLFAAADRRAVKENLQAIFPEKSPQEIRRIRKAIFRNFAKYLVDFFRFPLIDRAYLERNVKIENRHYLDEALAKGKGVITLTAHLGNWELGGVIIALSGYPFTAVALPHKNKRVDMFFTSQREKKGLTVLPLGNAMRGCLRVLQENRVLGLVGDRNFQEKGVTVDFFGKPTLMPAGPAAISLKTEAILVPGFMLRNPDDTFTLRFEKPVEFNATGEKKDHIRRLVSQYKTVIEDYIRSYPEQWSLFRRFWEK